MRPGLDEELDNYYSQRPMWDDDFAGTKDARKFQLGRVIERDDDIEGLTRQLKDQLNIQEKPSGRVVRTRDIDIFLRCDEMTTEELLQVEMEENPIKGLPAEEEDEEDPLWDEVVVEDAKAGTISQAAAVMQPQEKSST